MADEKLNPEDFNKIGRDAIATLKSLEDISKVITDSAKDMSRLTADSAAGFKENFSASKALAKELEGISADDLKNKNASTKIANKPERLKKRF